jgi:hypothetical protein
MMTIDNKLLFAAVEQRIAEGQQVQLPLRGTSMTPTLKDGDILTLEPVAGGQCAVGDVVLFRYCGLHLLHRIISIKGDTVTMQGDNCRNSETVKADDIVARLTEVRRGDAVLAVGSPLWQRISRRSLLRKKLRNIAFIFLDKRGRRQLRPWYFGGLLFLMWAPLNDVGLPLNNYIFGLRADHFLHASVYIPCSFFLFDLFPRRKWLTWVVAWCIGITTECVQYLLPFRGFDINDMVANFFGVTLGWLILVKLRGKNKNRQQTQ